MRSFGESPFALNCLIAALSVAISLAIDSTSPPGPVIAVYSAVACDLTVVSWVSTVLNDAATFFACSISAWRAATSSGEFDRSAQPFQNCASWLAMPLSPGSDSASSTWSSWVERVSWSPTCIAWARYWRSRNESRMRR